MKKSIIIAASLAALMTSCAPKGPVLTKSGLDPQNFVSEINGKQTALYTLTNDAGMEICVTNFGGRVVSIMAPAKDGSFKDVVLGFDNVSDYANIDNNFGGAIGRYGNRIGGASFQIDSVVYNLPKNDGENCLHGGPTGFHTQVFDVVEADSKHIKLLYNSADGDNNFPGNVAAYVTYTLTDDNALDISYEATTDKPTVINLTNHSYFNLSGDPNQSILGHDMTLNASNITPVDSTLIPTGEFLPVAGTPLDFTSAKAIGAEIGNTECQQLAFGNGYDHNWVLDTMGDISTSAATVVCPETGIVLDVYTNEPGLQVYTGNFLDSTITGKNGIAYGFRTAICLESQHYPDSPNKADWPSVVVRPGETYTSHCIYKFSVAE